MGEVSKISWTDATFNPWWGCEEVSPACDECYARTFSKRLGYDIWGLTADRRFFGDKHWNAPRKWNADAEKTGQKRLVFCASMADVGERRDDLVPHRNRLIDLIEETPWLTWLLLTKRPGPFRTMLPVRWFQDPPMNVRWGITTENQEMTQARLTAAAYLPHRNNVFLSLEPLLGEVRLDQISPSLMAMVDWLVIGGESGGRTRLMEERWVALLLAYAEDHGKMRHVKQLGVQLAKRLQMQEHTGKDPAEWPAWMRVQERP